MPRWITSTFSANQLQVEEFGLLSELFFISFGMSSLGTEYLLLPPDDQAPIAVCFVPKCWKGLVPKWWKKCAGAWTKPSPSLPAQHRVNSGNSKQESTSEALHSCKADLKSEDELLPLGIWSRLRSMGFFTVEINSGLPWFQEVTGSCHTSPPYEWECRRVSPAVSDFSCPSLRA